MSIATARRVDPPGQGSEEGAVGPTEGRGRGLTGLQEADDLDRPLLAGIVK